MTVHPPSTWCWYLDEHPNGQPGSPTLVPAQVHRIRAEVGAWAVPAEYVAGFGSAARGTMRTDSDTDLFVARSDEVHVDDPTYSAQTTALASHVTRWTGNDGRILELSAAEVPPDWPTATGS